MEWTDVLGLAAGICTTLSVIPQIKKAWETKKVEDVSPRMFSILIVGVFLWVFYGFFMELLKWICPLLLLTESHWYLTD